MTQPANPVVRFAQTVARCFADLSQVSDQFAAGYHETLSTDPSAVKRTAGQWHALIADLQVTIQELRASSESLSPGSEKVIEWTESDTAWGFRFGCDGLRKNRDAAKFLGVSYQTIYRLIADNKLRQGTGGQICYRSLTEYAHSLER